MHLGSPKIIYALVLLVIFLGLTFFIKNLQKRTSILSAKTSSTGRQAEITPKSSNIGTFDPTTPAPSARPVYFGMWTQGFWDKTTNTLHPEALQAIESKIGKKAAIAHYYRGWADLDSPALLSELQTIQANGWRPMVSVNPYFFDKCQAGGMPLYKAIAAGNCDAFIHSAGRNLKTFGKPVFLRFAWEMNTASMEWEIGRTGSSNSDFIAAWRRLHDIIYSEGAANVLFVFCPDTGGNADYSPIYPGDSYVDWICLDGYNWGITQSWSSWRSFASVFASSYASITQLAPSKPLMIGELNTTDQGGDKPGWYRDAFLTQIPQTFPKIKAVVVYNEDRTQSEHVNWLIDITQGSLQAFSKAIASPIYLSSF